MINGIPIGKAAKFKLNKKDNYNLSMDIVSNKENCLKSACAYLRIAEICIPKMFEEGALDIAIITNVAFSCELFLKTLIYEFNGVEPSFGHNLINLFNDLPDYKQNEIKNDLSFLTNKHEDFIKLLDESAEAFEYMRYSYVREVFTVNESFLFGFAKYLRDKCRTLFNDNAIQTQ